MSTCAECGQATPEPEVVIEEAVDLEPVAVAEVDVARIQADRDVTIAKIQSKVIDEELTAQLAALAAENEALRAAAAPQEQQQEATVVVAEPDPEPEPVAEAEPPVVEHSDEPAAKKKRSAWWG